MLAGCSGSALRTSGFGLAPTSTGLPDVGDLDRLASETGIGETGGDENVEMSAGVTELESPWRFRLQCDSTGEEQWIIRRIGPFKPASDTLRYTFCNSDDPFEFSGSVFSAVADFEMGCWRFQDVSMEGWREGYPGHFAGINIPPDAQPISEDGYLYFALIVSGEWAVASVKGGTGVIWEYDEPFLQPPVITSPYGPDGWPLLIDPGPDAQLPQAGYLTVWRCEGDTWDPDAAEEVDSFAPGEPEEWNFAHVDGTWTYAAALEVDNATPMGSPWSNPITRVHE
jgi:hypothetical protein